MTDKPDNAAMHVVIPNLLRYRDTLVVLDIQGDAFEFTHGFRTQHHRVAVSG